MLRLIKILLIVSLLFLTSCVSIIKKDNIILIKSTVFGLDISPSAENIANIRLGLIRSFYQQIPVYTNKTIAYPNYSSDVSADIGITHQIVNEHYNIGFTNSVK